MNDPRSDREGRFNLGRWLFFFEEDVPPNTANRSFVLEEPEGRRGQGCFHLQRCEARRRILNAQERYVVVNPGCRERVRRPWLGPEAIKKTSKRECNLKCKIQTEIDAISVKHWEHSIVIARQAQGNIKGCLCFRPVRVFLFVCVCVAYLVFAEASPSCEAAHCSGETWAGGLQPQVP